MTSKTQDSELFFYGAFIIFLSALLFSFAAVDYVETQSFDQEMYSLHQNSLIFCSDYCYGTSEDEDECLRCLKCFLNPGDGCLCGHMQEYQKLIAATTGGCESLPFRPSDRVELRNKEYADFTTKNNVASVIGAVAFIFLLITVARKELLLKYLNIVKGVVVLLFGITVLILVLGWLP